MPRRNPTARTSAGLFVLLVLGSACRGDVVAPLAALEPLGDNPSRLIYGGEAAEIDLPASIPAGSVLTIAVTTFGNGCALPGHTDVVLRDGGLDVYPYDIYRGHSCPDALPLFEHRASFTPALRGDLVLRFHGTQYSWSGETTTRTPVTLTRIVRVE